MEYEKLIDGMTVSQMLARQSWMVENDQRRKMWEFLTKDLKDHDRRILEVMLDNQRIQGEMIGRNRASAMGYGPASERTLMTDIFTFITNSYPIIRCMMDNMCTDIYTVQPITQESAYIFWLDYQYEDAGMYQASTSLCNHLDKSYGIVGEKGKVKGIKLHLDGQRVDAVVRKLLGDWSIEVGFKLLSQHGINPESELMTIMAKEHARELNQTILLDMLASAAAGNVNWHWTVPGVAPWTVLDPKVWAATLYDAISDANLLVEQQIYREANRLVMDPATYNRLRKLEKFRLFPKSEQVKKAGVEYMGILDEHYTICKAAFFPANSILVFYQGDTWDETTYVVSPFVPFWSTALWQDPRDFDNFRGTLSWVANKMTRPGAFATVSLSA